MAKTAVDKVTGEGAKYVAAGRKAQEKAQVRNMAANWTSYNPSAATSIPAHAETVPTPAHVAPTGSEHLSAAMFSPAKSRGSYEIARTATASMHPGGFGQAKSMPATPMHPGGYGAAPVTGGRKPAGVPMGNVRPGAPGPRSLPRASAPAARTTVSSRGSGTTAPAGKTKMRTAVKNKAARGKASVVRVLRAPRSRFEGRNAENLRKATGA